MKPLFFWQKFCAFGFLLNLPQLLAPKSKIYEKTNNACTNMR